MPNFRVHLYPFCLDHYAQALGTPLPLALALLTVARPLAKPTPLPLTPLLLNMGAFL